ncbi:hypothetical protein ASPZODRAFT_71981 [Penicilliopsis zonata CBS 506.65]|uniref:Fe2OG dioxygenase domain-containing protein n=1 Tax=Penicilliopsis zonata CBS 506.65 TaxID=1073090 RepID=A0A1L9SB97_9EURO|nr:hypothetical protein ASPZODRAFT_71981 [Penicilliopsis zonata CBS 506.65]OJJ44431.1 hypothetical protein ASPZODRAFT_71981 [Penicilliopsis zonata CBS 506.65]
MNFFACVENLPAVQTRKALLLLDLQNDFIRPNGALHVSNTADFLDQLPTLTQAFRRVGDVFWVRSHYETRRRLVDPQTQDDRIILREAFLSVEPARCCLAGSAGFQFPAPILTAIDSERDTVLEKTDYSAFASEGLVQSFRSRFVTEVYLCGSLSNVSVYATALDAVRYGFAVTVVEDCLGFRKFPRHAEAMRRMADILGADGITTTELYDELDWQETDAIARKGISRRTNRSVIPAGIEGVMDELDVRTSPKTVHSRGKKKRADRGSSSSSLPASSAASDGSRRLRVAGALAEATGMESDLKASLRDLASLRSARRSQATASNAGDAQEKKRVTPRVRRRQEPSNSGPPSTTPSTPAERRPSTRPRPATDKRAATAPDRPLRPGDRIGEGDSRIIHDLDLPEDAFTQIRREVAWQHMYHLSGQVPRLVAVQGQALPEGAIPIYRHPADESPPLLPLSRMVNQVRIQVERIVGHPLNHVLIQLYRDGQDRISEHSDKTLDIVRGSSICNVSLGAQRVMVLRSKESAATTTGGRDTQRVPMPHESLFILGQKTNMKWLHGIRPDKRPEVSKTAEERAFGGERISLTFRQIGTFIDPAQDLIWGQGAVSKTREHAGRAIHGNPAETERLVRCFGQENRSLDLDWDALYGGGFDVVNFITAVTARLVLRGDAIADLRVQLCLTENGLRYTPVAVSPGKDLAGNALEDDVQRRPLYVNADGAAVAGDLAILTHFAHLAATQHESPARPGVEMLRGGDKLEKIERLLHIWRQYQATTTVASELEHTLSTWETALGNGHKYIDGGSFGIDDCALWPLLREMVQTDDSLLPATRYPQLHQYYLRVEKRGCVKALLDDGYGRT